MLKGFTEKGEMKNVKVTEGGELLVKNSNDSGDKPTQVEVIENEVVLSSNIYQLSTEVTNVEINNKVTTIEIANYSETNDIKMIVNDKEYNIGANLSIDFPINKTLESISLVSTAENTKVQLVIKGVENI